MYLRKSYWPLPFILYLPAFIFIYHLTFKGILRKVVFSFFEDETIKMIYNFSAFKLIITSLLEELEDTKEVIRINNLQKKRSVAAYTLSRHGVHIGRLKIIGK